MPEVQIRKRVLLVEEVFHEGGPVAAKPQRRAAALVVIHNPYAGTYVEKIEYWAFVWGTCVMTATGFLLWFNNFALRHFPKWVEDASTALHYYEAILATASILVWHMYTVVFDPEVYPMDPSWITGKGPSHQLPVEEVLSPVEAPISPQESQDKVAVAEEPPVEK